MVSKASDDLPEPGDDYQFAARDFEVHIPEVMDPGAEYFDRIFHFR